MFCDQPEPLQGGVNSVEILSDDWLMTREEFI